MQPLLDYKQNLEQILQVELAQITEACAREQIELERLRESLREVATQLRSCAAENQLNLELIRLTLRFLESIRERAVQQAAVVAEMESRVETKRQELVKVMQEKKALEKLKERFLAELEEQARQAENRVNDEIGTTLHHLSSREAAAVESPSTA